MAETIRQRRNNIIAKYSKYHTDLFEEFLVELQHERYVKIVEILEAENMSMYDIIDLVVYGHFEFIEKAYTLDDVARWYLEDEINLIPAIFSTRYIKVEQVIEDMHADGYNWIPLDPNGYLIYRRI